MIQKSVAWCLFVIATIAAPPVCAEHVLVAVAANFNLPFREIATEFERATGHQVRVVSGASGAFYAQIKNGAPFDVFFSADRDRPKLLEEEGLGVKDFRFTYAIGRLVLWSPNAALIKGGETLRSKTFKRLAVANPKTAPYGVAAMQTMQNLGLWDSLKSQLVMGRVSVRPWGLSNPAMHSWDLSRSPRCWTQRSRERAVAGRFRLMRMHRLPKT